MEPNQSEFLEIVSAYQGIIHKVNMIYFKSDVDKQDNFQEVVYQLWRTFSTLVDKNKLASWIYAVAINTAISKIRKDRKLVFTNDKQTIAYSEPHTDIEQSISYKNLLDAVRKLNEVDRSIILLYMEDYSYDDISGIIGISNTNVGVKIHRIKNQLKKLLRACLNFTEIYSYALFFSFFDIYFGSFLPVFYFYSRFSPLNHRIKIKKQIENNSK